MAAAETARPTGEKKQQKLDPLKVRLERLGLVNDWDFVLHLPLRYEDETTITPIGELTAHTTAQMRGTITRSGFIQTGRGQQFCAELAYETGCVRLRFIYYYPSVPKQLHEGAVVRVYGEPRPAFQGGLEVVHPKYKTGKSAEAELPRSLTPVYPAGEGIQQAWLRKRIARALLDLDIRDLLPKTFREELGLPGLREAINYLHNPPSGADVAGLQNRTAPQWRRLIFDELLAQQITLRKTRRLNADRRAPALSPATDALRERFLGTLPFSLTNAQKRVVAEIDRDLAGAAPMNRLIQGDVGSGKTVVAALAALRAVDAGFQTAVMAPTEILAEQHYRRFKSWLEPLGIRVVWLTGRLRAKEKAAALEAIASGAAQMTVGTHALIQEGVSFKNLGLSIVDEQHRFGVSQRLALRTPGASGLVPHLLMLSATPIPRTLAMSYLADLDVSVIDELPPGRTPVVTKLVRLDRRGDVLGVVRATAAEGRQIYWVCPLIEESEKLDLTPAVRCRDELAAELPELNIGLVHGAMSPEEKEAVMDDFVAGRTQVLVSTTVIEVGVDVPNASLMVIEHAERFGLAQLHQLRGRVGRGAAKSACILLFDSELSDTGKERLKVIRESSDGFEIARRDLELRGPGEFLGERQSGMPLLRFAELERDEGLLAAAGRFAERWLAESPDDALRHAERWFVAKADFLSA